MESYVHTESISINFALMLKVQLYICKNMKNMTEIIMANGSATLKLVLIISLDYKQLNMYKENNGLYYPF